jgi:hypothetical protein
MVKLDKYKLRQVIQAYKLIDNVTDDLEGEKPDRTDTNRLGTIWSLLYEEIEEQIGEDQDVDKYVNEIINGG